MKIARRVLSLILCISVLLSMYTLTNAAADPTFKFEKLMSWNGETTIPNAATTVLVNSLKVKEFEGENVIQVVGRNTAGEPAAGRQINYWTLSDNKSLGKKLSYEVYIPEYVYYTSLRGCYTRFESETIGGSGANIGYNFETIFASNLTADGYVTTVTLNSGDTATIKGTKNIKNGMWHNVELFICDKETHLYIDGAYVGTADTVFDKAINPGFDHAFKGFQVLPGKNGSTDVPDENAGIYLKNILLTTYDYVDENFVGLCSQNRTELTVTFSESPANDQDLSDVAVYNTEMGNEVSIKTPVIEDGTMKIELLSELDNGTEYVIHMPDDFKSVRGTKLYADIYFIGTGIYKAVNDFEEYASDTDVTDGSGNVSSITSGMGSNATYKNFVTVDASWTNMGLMGIEEQNGSNVFTVRNVPTNPRLGKDIRFGILTDEILDLKQGNVTGEFDIMLPNIVGIYNFDIMPYSYNESVASTPQAEVNYGGINSGNSYKFDSSNIAYSMLQAPSVFCRESGKQEYSAKFNTRADGKIVHQANMDGNQNYYHSGEYTEGTWVTIKFVVSKTGDGTYQTDWYYNGTYFGKQTNEHQADATDYFRGIRFGMYYASGAPSSCIDLAYIDNFTVYQTRSAAKVTKVRVINRDGEDFAMLSTGAGATAKRAEVYFGAALDYSNAEVNLEDEDGNVITTMLEYDETDNKLIAEFNKLLAPDTTYLLTVSGLKTILGANIDDYSARFTTSDNSEFIITLEVSDEYGNVITDTSALNIDDKVLVKAEIINATNEDKTVMFSIATYNENSMKDMDAQEFTVLKGESLVLGYDDDEPISAVVKDIKGLLVGAYVCESFADIKPVMEAVFID